MATTEVAGRPAPGFKFFPADHVLITQYLRPRVAGVPIDGRYKIHDADAYSAPPDQLVAGREEAPGTDKHDGKRGYWYFFTPVRRLHETKTKNKNKNGGGRRQRAVGGEGYTWHSEGGVDAVLDDGGRRVGYRRKLNYVFKESPGSRNGTRLGWCMTELGLDDEDTAAGLVLCKICVSRHKRTTTYPSVMKAMADSRKRKAGDDPHPDAPRPRTPRRQEMEEQLHEIELWLNSDLQDDAADVDGSVDPAGFFDGILDVQELLCGKQQQQSRSEDDDCRSEVTYEAAPPFVSSQTPSSPHPHVMAKCSNQHCEICIQQMIEELDADLPDPYTLS